MPSTADLEEAKRRVGYQEGKLHFAVTGIAGSGKSSLVNALRGLRNRDADAAATGIAETTLHLARFPDANPENPVVWFDIPGAGTLQIKDWQYFHDQGLYVFDALIVLVDNRFTATDVAILRNARLFGIPCYIVRSKADTHVRNVMKEMGYDSDDDEEQDASSLEKLEREAREHFIAATRHTVGENLRRADLPDQRVYIVSNSTILGAVKGSISAKASKKMVDEKALLDELSGDAKRRRGGEGRLPANEICFPGIIPKAERQLQEGIQPVIMPSTADLEAARRRVGYREGYYHFAATGIAGSGKSSLINAFRGLRSGEANAAATGITETTLQMARFPDANPTNHIVWYDIPGAGTLQVHDWQYFNDQGLYIFDALVVLFDNRFTVTDVAILRNARLFNIPCYIVRSKADAHIRNVMIDLGYDSDDDEHDARSRAKFEAEARERFVSETKKTVRENLRRADLPDQRVYVLSNSTMLSTVKGSISSKMSKRLLDEKEFLKDF
ncbi:hypothetical protein CONPUDRAFT_113150, partial [Coniophora puteana RWD-64-598 SS2]